MEPFLTTVFDGPQHDDILAAQRGYGDSLEYNDDITTATNIKPLEFGAGSDVINLSLDSNADVDVYSIDVEADSSLNVIVTPIGFSYLNGPQFADGSCSTGEITSSLDIQDLWFEILDTDGTTVLASVDDNGLGLEEILNELALRSGAGTYYIRIRGDNIDQIQLYELSIAVQENIQDTPDDNSGTDTTGITNNGVFSSGFD
jgi:hypothetical protein